MNLKKAREILTLMGNPEFDGHTEDILTARQIGIEAIEREIKWRSKFPKLPFTRLPSETEDLPPLKISKAFKDGRPGVFVGYAGKLKTKCTAQGDE